MRLNKPITNKEFDFDGSRSLYSTTDLRGCITFANPYFVEVSGFSEDELIGQPHNIVRHPDMPPAAFGDLWTTIKSGGSWTAMVKNRRKNGDHYWVQATVTPIFESGVATGFMSVRTKPTREQINAAESLYKAENEHPGSLQLRRGRVLPNGLCSRIIDRCELSLTARIGLTHAILLTLTSALGATAFLPQQMATLRPELAIGLAGLTAATIAMSWRQLITKAVTPIKEAAALVQSIAGGDLTLTIDAAGTGETGDLMRGLRQLSVNLKSLIGDIRENFSMIRSVTGELAQGNSDLSARTDSQASSLEETAASMEELTSTVRQNLDNTNQAGGVAKNAMATAERGGELMTQVVETIGEISASSEKIANIVNIINSIASQTNLLALNAAVESARAGEAGRGFAVVATEVRSLAQRSAEAAKDIKGLIESSVEKINAGTVLSRDAGAIMQEIISTVGRVSKVMNDIAAASAEQSTGIEQVNDAITQMDEVTQRNASLVEMAASATNGLQDQGRKVMQSLAIFKLGQAGNGAAAATEARPASAEKKPKSARRLAAA